MSPPRNRIEQDMTMALTADQAPRAPHLALRILLILLSALLTLGALEQFPAVRGYIPLRALSIFAAPHITEMNSPLMPLLTGAALLLAISGRVRYAITALGALMLLAWAIELPEIASRARKPAGGEMGLIQLAYTFIYPAIAVAAIWLALRDRLLGLALAFVALPTLVYWLVMGPFIIVVLISGKAAP
jgi:hypothetical protein